MVMPFMKTAKENKYTTNYISLSASPLIQRNERPRPYFRISFDQLALFCPSDLLPHYYSHMVVSKHLLLNCFGP